MPTHMINFLLKLAVPLWSAEGFAVIMLFLLKLLGSNKCRCWMIANGALSEIGLSADVALSDAGVWRLIPSCLGDLVVFPSCW
ncbi:hypothetical protein Nepgr_014676 [Nepenthes gracilis]|uniref:Uncharacterized protein n=1 Tax=Nepenthes gracilis TaxID=150966 RepID=A0AAD3SLA7_NEPGR|nr:hypothetical protein Nepgr_014676 [Nepenthes gracilis]